MNLFVQGSLLIQHIDCISRTMSHLHIISLISAALFCPTVIVPFLSYKLKGIVDCMTATLNFAYFWTKARGPT